MFSALSEYAESPEPGVRIWSARLDAPSSAEQAQLGSFLSAEERARAARFHFEKDRGRYVTARGLLRHLLACELRAEPSALVFEAGAKGKPMLAQPDGNSRAGLRFNISHSEGEALFALAWQREVGIDLEAGERPGRTTDFLALAQRVLSASELDNWRTLPTEAERRAAFLRAWTRKEAYAKATGEGIFNRLADVELITDSHAPKPYVAVDKWIVHDLWAPAGYAAALAVEQRSE